MSNGYNKNPDFGASTDESNTNQQDDTTQLTVDEIQAHYKNAKGALEPLGKIKEASQALIKHDQHGWYLTRDHPSPTERQSIDGFVRQQRARLWNKDYDQTVEDLDRVMYSLTSYKVPSSVDWVAARYDERWEHDGVDNPMPKSNAITALSVWGDMDLVDELKTKRGEAGLSDEEQEIAEAAYDAYIDEFAKLVGGRDAVFALDSVGGMYIMTAPAVTQPIAVEFSDSEAKRTRIFEEIIDRSTEFLEDAHERVLDSVDGAGSVVDPDFVNNTNRAYKTPLSIHKTYDAVVRPVEVGSFSFEAEPPTPFHDVDDSLRAYVEKWARAFTHTSFEDRTGTLVEELFPEYSADHESWEDALDAWATEQIEEEQERQKRREEARQRVQKREEEFGDAITGVGVTTEMQGVYDAVDSVPVKDLVQKYCKEWEPTGRKNHFNPGRSLWKDSDSGTSCFVDPDKNSFGDVGTQAGGGPAEFMALVEGIISSPDADLTGADYWDAVDALRDDGYTIPAHVPEAGGEYDKTPRWALVDAARALDVVPAEMFVTRSNDDDSWLDFGSAWAVERTLEALEDVGIDHGWTDDDIPDSDDDDVGLAEKYAGTKIGDFLAKLDFPGQVAFDYPVKEMNDEIEVHFIPLTGDTIRMAFVATDQHPSQDRGAVITATQIEHKPNTLDLKHDLDTTHKRKTRAKNLADETGYSRDEILSVLSEFAGDIMDEEVQEKLQSAVHRWVDNRVGDVVFYPSEEESSSEIDIQMAPDGRNPDVSGVTFTLAPEMLDNDNPGNFRAMYIRAFGEKLDLDATSWSLLADKWLDQKITRERERDNEEDAWVDSFIDAVDTDAKVFTNDEKGRDALESSPSKPRGVYVEDWDGVEDGNPRDVVFVPGAWADQFRKDHDFDKASQRLLRKEGILAAPGKKPKSSEGWEKRPTVWPVDASETKWTPENAVTKEADDAPGVDPDGDGSSRRGDDR